MLIVHDEIATALREGTPIVALESAVITAGLPREPLPLPAKMGIDGWRSGQPCNLELAHAMERAVRAAGAIPATIALIDGRLHIGLGSADVERLALDARAGKAAGTDLAFASASKHTAGTTVSGTLAAMNALAMSPSERREPLTSSSLPLPISIFATGGIGGVHREWHKRLDISADLRAIASTPVCIVCSGAKSILDLPATLEALEALNVPVLGYRTHLFPQFQSLGSEDLRLRLRIDDAPQAAAVCRAHWCDLGQGGGVILANPVPEALAVDALEMTLAVEAAERAAKHADIAGPQRTPFLLEEIARLTNNRSLLANLALLVSNARLAAAVACCISEHK